MRSLKLLLLFLITLLNTSLAHAQFPLSERAEISLLTCGSGDELYSVFGHTAIRVHDPAANIDTVYNFGTFDFDTSNFYLKFIKGDLQYFVSVSSYVEFVEQYTYYNRDVIEQALNLSARQKQAIFDELNARLMSERKYYTYKFIDRNCTTMVADIIDAKIPGNISLENSDKGKTNREIIYSYLNNKFYENLGINLMFGFKTDRLQDKLFLPKHLMEGVSHTQVEGNPLAKSTAVVYKSTSERNKMSLWNNYYTFLILVAALIFVTKKRTVLMAYMIVAGILGIFFCTVGLYSFHSEVTQNYNALLFNPFFIVLAFAAMKNKFKLLRPILYLCTAILVLYVVLILNKPHLIMMLPLIVFHGILLYRIHRTQKSFLYN